MIVQLTVPICENATYSIGKNLTKSIYTYGVGDYKAPDLTTDLQVKTIEVNPLVATEYKITCNDNTVLYIPYSKVFRRMEA